jgi:hypothetical protein
MHVARYRAAIALLWLFTALIGFLSGARAEDYPNRPGVSCHNLQELRAAELAALFL